MWSSSETSNYFMRFENSPSQAWSPSNAILDDFLHMLVLQSASKASIQMQLDEPINLSVVWFCVILRKNWCISTFQPATSDRISGIPSLCCQVGILDGSSTNERCNESGRRATQSISATSIVHVPVKLTLHIPQATVHSSLVAEAWFAWHSMPNCC